MYNNGIKGGKIMEKTKKVELTSELYKKICSENVVKIVELKGRKDEILNIIEEELEVYEELLKKRKEIDELLNQSKNNLHEGRRMKYIVSRKLSKQNRKAKKLNRIFTKGLYINLDKFCIQEPEAKKR